MLAQKERARKHWKGTGDISENKIWFDSIQNLDSTEFIGYEKSNSESVVKKNYF